MRVKVNFSGRKGRKKIRFGGKLGLLRNRGDNFPKDAWRVNVLGMIASGILDLEVIKTMGLHYICYVRSFFDK